MKAKDLENTKMVTARVQNFKNRLSWLAPLMGGYLQALQYIVKAKLSLKGQGTAVYGTKKFYFRPIDMSAIKEVLVDQEYDFLKPALKNLASPRVLDVGAHIGLFSIWILENNSSSQIHSLEASPGTFSVLQKNAKTAHSHWTVQNGAGWGSNENLSFSDEGQSMGHKVSTNGTVKVQGVTLENLMNNFPDQAIDILKIDIEGSEEQFLISGEASLKKVKNLVIEIHPQLCDENNVREILARNFTNIIACTNRLSQKPLLHCYN